MKLQLHGKTDESIFSCELNQCSNDYILTDDNQEYIIRKYGEGYKAIYPTNNQLQLDIDSTEAINYYHQQLDKLIKIYPNITVESVPSFSGEGHRHITITVPSINMSDWQKIALQYWFGSDSKREGYCVYRLLKGDPSPIKFFRKA